MSMKALMENMKMLGSRYSFDVLLENCKKGIFTKEQTYLIWESQMLHEADVVLNEGLLDALKRGYQMGKNIAGKAKEAYQKAVEVFGNFYEKISDQLLRLAVEGQIQTNNIIKGLGKLSKSIQKACKAHPVLCRGTKIVAAMTIVSITMAMFSGLAEAAVDAGSMTGAPAGKHALTDEWVSAAKGMLANLTAKTDDPDSKQALFDAYKWLETAHASQDLETLKEGPKILQRSMKVLYEITKADPELFNFLVSGCGE